MTTRDDETIDAAADLAERYVTLLREEVEIEYHQFALRMYGSPSLFELQFPDGLVYAGWGGAVLSSGGSDHRASVEVRLYQRSPRLPEPGKWEACERGVFEVDVVKIVLEGATGLIGAVAELPAPGRYGILACCSGRARAAAAARNDQGEAPGGLETWLIAIWPMS